MNNIQIGIDIATSVSVIGAAIAFIYSQWKESNKARKVHLKDLRISKLTNVIASLIEKLEEGFALDEETKMAVAKGETEDIPMQAYKYAKSLEIRMTVFLESDLAVWGSEREIQTITELRDKTKEWYLAIFKDVKPISNLLTEIKMAVQEIARELRDISAT